MQPSDDILIETRSRFCTLTFQIITQFASGKSWDYIRTEMHTIQKEYHKLRRGEPDAYYEELKQLNVKLASLLWRFVWDFTARAGNDEWRRESRDAVDKGYVNQLKDPYEAIPENPLTNSLLYILKAESMDISLLTKILRW